MKLLLSAAEGDATLCVGWLLTDEEKGTPLAKHHVDLTAPPIGPSPAPDPADAWVWFANLERYARSRDIPDSRVADGARIVTQAGEWAGTTLLGEEITAAISAAAPATVHVVAKAAVGRVLEWPLELAHHQGKPLAARGDIAFVYDPWPDDHLGAKAPVTDAIRILAVFSLPTQNAVVALRRERDEVSRLISSIRTRDGAAIKLKVAQYGVTRERLRALAADERGWDILHLSGHGADGLFTLEKADGSPDLVTATDLAALLRPARGRVKLSIASACKSAAGTTARAYRLLGLTDQAAALESEWGTDAEDVPAPSLAEALVKNLDCAVVAMRYSVTDEFGIAWPVAFYKHLLGEGEPVDVAAAAALPQAVGPAPSVSRPAVSLASVGLFDRRAIGLRLDVPRGNHLADPDEQRMTFFPGEPERFVGRTAVMAAASAVLAPGSGRAAVLLHGMPGAGKTCCALELAYRHRDAFTALAFWRAPARIYEDGEDGEGQQETDPLADFASHLNARLSDCGFMLADQLGADDELSGFLLTLRGLLEANAILLVLDGLEPLLTTDGAWRDPRWARLMSTLTSHEGGSRAILTSRIAPASGTSGSTTRQTLAVPVHPLSLDEAGTLARELPNLRALLHCDAGDLGRDADGERVTQVLRMVQGHPTLLELADEMATDRSRLDRQLAAAEQAVAAAAVTGAEALAPTADSRSAAEHRLAVFFRDGAADPAPGQLLDMVGGWTLSALRALPEQARLAAEFVACAEGDDRWLSKLDANWAYVWNRLDRSGVPPTLAPLLDGLAAAALLEAEAIALPSQSDQEGADSQARTEVQGAEGDQDSVADPLLLVWYHMHPVVAAVIANATEPEVREAVDAEFVAYWEWIVEGARDSEDGEGEGARGPEDGENSDLVVRAGLAAAPYLLRLGEWGTAETMLEEALLRDDSPRRVRAMLPWLRQIATATGDVSTLALALSDVDPVEAERLLRDAMAAAVSAADYWSASVRAGRLANLLRRCGRPEDALEMVGQKEEFTRQAERGPWTQLSDQGQRLQLLGRMGEHEHVLAEVDRLRGVLADLPARPAGNDVGVNPWNVREFILGIGRTSAEAMKDWQGCLDLNAERLASMRQRNAPIYEITEFRFGDADPLIELDRLDEAERLLAECQRVFMDHHDATWVAAVLAKRADLEIARGHWQVAADLDRAVLRHGYARPMAQNAVRIATGHNVLACDLAELGGDPVVELAHRLAAALIYQLSGMPHAVSRVVRAVAACLGGGADAEPLPSDAEALSSWVADIVAITEETDGVRLSALLATLEPDPQAVEQALAEVLRAATDPRNV